MNEILKKHDPMARKFLSDLSVAKEFLNTYLMPELKAKCDLNTLTIESGSYVENDLKTHCADIVYKVNLLDNSGCAYIYTLIEHQSTPKKLMPFRILKYQLAIIQKHLDENKGSKFPIVAPLVFYNGTTSPYPYLCDIAELFADPELYKKVQLGKFKLIDLTSMDDDQILQHGVLALLEIFLKHIQARDFATVIDVIIKALQLSHNLGINHNLIEGAFSYVVNAREQDDIKQLLLQINKIPYYEEALMSYAETLKQEGIREGIREGEHRAQVEIAQQLLKSGVDCSIIASATHLSASEIEEMRKTLH